MEGATSSVVDMDSVYDLRWHGVQFFGFAPLLSFLNLAFQLLMVCRCGLLVLKD